MNINKELVQSLLSSALSAAMASEGFIKPFLTVPGLQSLLDEVVEEALCTSLDERCIMH